MKMGSDENGWFTFIDCLAIAGFIVGIQNLNENIDQNQLSEELNRVLTEVHSHLQMQDEKIDEILEAIKHD